MKYFSKDFLTQISLILPKEYQKVEYIQSTGTQYLNTGISCAGGIRCIYNATYQNRGYLCGAHNTAEPYGRCGANTTGNVWQFGYGETCPGIGVFSLNTNYDVEYKTTYLDAYLKVKGGSYSSWSTLSAANGQTVSTLNALVFTQQYALTHGEALTRAQLYSLKIYNSNDELVGDFVPCYRKSDGEIGLYNLINDSFLTNQGTGAFLKGRDVVTLPDGYQEVEYIRNSGTVRYGAYIDTGIKPNANIEISIDFKDPDKINYGNYFGSDGALRFQRQGTANTYTYYFGNSNLSANLGSFDDEIKLTFNKNGIYNEAGGKLSSAPAGSNFTTNFNICIFAGYYAGSLDNTGSMYLYNFKIRDNGELIRNFIPCYRKSDNVIGLYDVVNKTFYINAGSDGFTKGPDIQ